MKRPSIGTVVRRTAGALLGVCLVLGMALHPATRPAETEPAADRD